MLIGISFSWADGDGDEDVAFCTAWRRGSKCRLFKHDADGNSSNVFLPEDYRHLEKIESAEMMMIRGGCRCRGGRGRGRNEAPEG